MLVSLSSGVLFRLAHGLLMVDLYSVLGIRIEAVTNVPNYNMVAFMVGLGGIFSLWVFKKANQRYLPDIPLPSQVRLRIEERVLEFFHFYASMTMDFVGHVSPSKSESSYSGIDARYQKICHWCVMRCLRKSPCKLTEANRRMDLLLVVTWDVMKLRLLENEGLSSES